MAASRILIVIAFALFTFACGVNLDLEAADQSCVSDDDCALVAENTCTTCGSFPTSDEELIELHMTNAGCFAPPVCEPIAGFARCRSERCVIKIDDTICDAPNENCRCDIDDPQAECEL